MTILAILFVIGAVIMFAVVLLGTIDAHVMPWSCPRCHVGSDQEMSGASRPWYVAAGPRVQCRSCGTFFREAPNGMLVEDR